MLQPSTNKTTIQIGLLQLGQFPTVDEDDQDDSEDVHSSEGTGNMASIEEL